MMKRFYDLSDYEIGLFDKYIKGFEFSKMGSKTTICLLTCINGFEVVGTSACVNPDDFDEYIGKKFAIKDAIRDLDRYVGFLNQEIMYEE